MYRMFWIAEATTDSATEFDVNATQLEENEGNMQTQTRDITMTREQGTNTMHVVAHLQSRSRRETVDHADRPQATSTRVKPGERGDHLFLSNATDPQLVKAVLNRLETGSEPDWWVRLNHLEPLTRLVQVEKSRPPLCNTPKTSSATAGRIERANRKVEEGSRVSRSWFEGEIGGTCLFLTELR